MVNCRFCHRCKSCTRWRRKEGRECNTCPQIINKERPGCSAEVKQAIEEEHAQNEEALKAWLVKVEAKEAPKEQKALGRQSQLLEARRRLGNLWPSQIYEAKFKCKPQKKDLESFQVGGKNVRGVLLDPKEHGCPVGVIEMSIITQNGVEVISKVKSTKDDTRQECADVLQKAQKRLSSMATKPVEPAEEGVPSSHNLVTPLKRKQCDDDDMLGLWGDAADVSDDEDSDEDEDVEKHRRSAAGRPRRSRRSGRRKAARRQRSGRRRPTTRTTARVKSLL